MGLASGLTLASGTRFGFGDSLDLASDICFGFRQMFRFPTYLWKSQRMQECKTVPGS